MTTNHKKVRLSNARSFVFLFFDYFFLSKTKTIWISMQICKYGRMYCVDWLCRYTFHRIISNWSCVLHAGLGFMEDGSQGSGGDGKSIIFLYYIFSAGCCWLAWLTSVWCSIHRCPMKWLIVSTDSLSQIERRCSAMWQHTIIPLRTCWRSYIHLFPWSWSWSWITIQIASAQLTSYSIILFISFSFRSFFSLRSCDLRAHV